MRRPRHTAVPGAGPGRVAAVRRGRSPELRPLRGRPGPGFAVRARFLPDSSLPGVTVAPGSPVVAARAAGQAAARRLARTGRAHVGGHLALRVLGTPAGPAALARTAERAGAHAVTAAFPTTRATSTTPATSITSITSITSVSSTKATPCTPPTTRTPPATRRKSR
ncbi:hypothetical protein BGK72_03320 [Streptomyces agglomeratus]|nr:hypothetical protein BGK72_03320 [Streptomyces agglomeratus]